MKINDFKIKKYGDSFIDLKKLVKEFNENEKNKKKYFILKKAGKNTQIISSFIIW